MNTPGHTIPMPIDLVRFTTPAGELLSEVAVTAGQDVVEYWPDRPRVVFATLLSEGLDVWEFWQDVPAGAGMIVSGLADFCLTVNAE